MKNAGFESEYLLRGYVVFEDNTSLWWLKILKKGFRHCYLLLQTEEDEVSWLEINPMSNQVVVKKHRSILGIPYINHIKRQKKNAKIVRVEIKQAPLKCAPIGIFSCVEFVKRVLGIHQKSIITPYQLYKFLYNNQK